MQAAEAVDASLDVWADNVETRDAIILEAIDRGGQRRSDVARWSNLTPARITQIIARRAAAAG